MGSSQALARSISRRGALACAVAPLALAGCEGVQAAGDVRQQLERGGTVKLPAGLFILENLEIPAGTRIEGMGELGTQLVLSPGRGNLFRPAGALTISGVTLAGNGGADPYYAGMLFASTPGALVLDSVRLENCGASYWVNGTAGGSITARAVSVTTAPGNAPGPQGIGLTQYVAAVFSAYGGCTLDLADCIADLPHIKQFAAVWADSVGILQRCKVSRCGMGASIADDSGAYGLLCYREPNNGRQPSIKVSDCDIEARSCGIYTANAASVTLERNTWRGQSDGLDATIPKGGIALNGTTEVAERASEFVACRINRAVYTGFTRYREFGSA